MKYNADELMSEIRAEVLQNMRGREFTLQDDVYPIARRLRRTTKHKNQTVKSTEAACRCTMQRLREENRLIFVDGRGTYRLASVGHANAGFDCDKFIEEVFSSKQKALNMTRSTADIEITFADVSLADALEIPAYKGQRDTPKHRAKLLKDPTFNPEHPTLGNIAFAEYKGRVFVVDGNTTLLMHKMGDIALKSVLKQRPTYHCQSMDEMKIVYDGFNNPGTSKGANDTFYSAVKLAGIRAQSKFFLAAKGTSMLRFAEGVRRGNRAAYNSKSTPVLNLVLQWKKELEAIDANLCAPRSKSPTVNENAGLLAAQAVQYRKHPAKAAQFWELFYASCGEIGDAGLPWNRLYNQVLNTLANGNSRETTLTILETTLAAFEHCDDDDVKNSALHPKKFRILRADGYLPVKNFAAIQKGRAQTRAPRVHDKHA